VFQGELQLVRWSESSTNGATVTFWVHPEDLEHFKLLQARKGKVCGTRLGAVMVEIGEDETVVPQETAQPTPAPTPAPRRYHPPSVGALGMLAVRWCRDPVFHEWVSNVANDQWMLDMVATELDPADIAKAFILSECGIAQKYGQAASRKYLDTDEQAAAAFQQKIRQPYMQYLNEQGLSR
jgi:hypothetical protein